MSNKNRQRLSLKGDQNALTTVDSEQQQAAPSTPIQEKTMEAQTETQSAEAVPEPTAKQMAEAEAINAQRLRQQIDNQNIPPPPEPVMLVEIASRGYDALHEAHRQASEHKVAEYVPPPRTARQMSALQEELEAGRQAQQRAEAHQKLHRPPGAEDAAKEGLNTPVYRPNDVVPDPMTGRLGAIA